LAASRAASPARRKAVSVLEDFFSGGRRPVDLESANGSLAEADRDLFRELVRGVLRNRSRLDWEIDRALRFPIARLQRPLREILETALFQIRFLDRIPPRAAVHEAVEMARARSGEGGSRLVNGVLRRLIREPEAVPANGDAASLALEYSHPEFLVARWLQRWGAERTRSILQADNRRGEIDLLFDPRRWLRGDLAEALREERVETRELPLSPNGLTVASGNPIGTGLFRGGAFYVCDAGAQALPSLLPGGDLLLDLAAAPGGKAVAALYSGRFARVVGLDRSVSRLGRMRENFRRLGLPANTLCAADLKGLPLPDGGFPRVLLDAPCSGTGTLRKNPEIRYRLSPESLASLAHAQRALLAGAAAAVSPGGFLLYATCSVEPEENEQIAAGLLEARPDFEAWEIEPPKALAPHVEGARFRILPDEGSDGFTAHLLRRRPIPV
jgi:16S rRNA (cytosine967-C5)-methyltransferase